MQNQSNWYISFTSWNRICCGIMLNILQYLNIRSLCNVKRSSLIQQCRKRFGSNDFERVRDIALSLSYEGRRSIDEIIPIHPAKRLYLLMKDIKGVSIVQFWSGEQRVPTPIVCACQHGRINDVNYL